MKLLILLTIPLLFAPAPTNTVPSDKFQAAEQITIDSPVNHDVYLAGERITVNAPVRGDMLAAAGTIILRDSLLGNLTAAGGTLTLNGPVLDDVFVMGGTVRVESPVAGDIIAMGGEVVIDKNVTSGQDVVVLSGEVQVNGTVAGNVIVRGGEVQLNGECQGNLEVQGGEITINGLVRGASSLAAERIELTPSAEMYGDVRYWLPEGTEPPDFSAALSGATAQFDESLNLEDDFSWLGNQVPWFSVALAYVLAVLLTIGFIFWVFPNKMDRAGKVLHEDFMRSFGYGILYLIGVPLVIALLLISFIGIPLGLVFLLAYGVTVAFGHVITSVVVAYSLRDRYQYDWGKGWMILVAFLIFSVLRMVTLTPFVGFFISVLLVGASLGALLIPLIRKEQPVAA
ncbi:MAG: hypothetical protein AAGE93_01785 [Bacteroidota bacterium]